MLLACLSTTRSCSAASIAKAEAAMKMPYEEDNEVAERVGFGGVDGWIGEVDLFATSLGA